MGLSRVQIHQVVLKSPAVELANPLISYTNELLFDTGSRDVGIAAHKFIMS